MCGIAGYSLEQSFVRRADAGCPGPARRHRRARRGRSRATRSAASARSSPSSSSAPARASSSSGCESRRGATTSSSTSATTPRVTRRSRPTTTRSATAPSSASTTGSSRTTTTSSRGTAASAREPEMTVDSEAIFALAGHTERPHRARGALGAIATAWMDERDAGRLYAARGVGRRSGSVAAPRGVLRVHAGCARDCRADASDDLRSGGPRRPRSPPRRWTR